RCLQLLARLQKTSQSFACGSVEEAGGQNSQSSCGYIGPKRNAQQRRRKVHEPKGEERHQSQCQQVGKGVSPKALLQLRKAGACFGSQPFLGNAAGSKVKQRCPCCCRSCRQQAARQQAKEIAADQSKQGGEWQREGDDQRIEEQVGQGSLDGARCNEVGQCFLLDLKLLQNGRSPQPEKHPCCEAERQQQYEPQAARPPSGLLLRAFSLSSVPLFPVMCHRASSLTVTRPASIHAGSLARVREPRFRRIVVARSHFYLPPKPTAR